MDFALSEDQEMLKTSAREFLSKECTEAVVRETLISKEGFSPGLWHKIAELGWLGIIFPEKYGGIGGNVIDLAVLFEEMGRAIYISPYLSSVVLCGLTILDAGSEEQKNSLIPAIIKGEKILAMALTEPQSSWDGHGWEPQGISVTATRSKDQYIINGTKLFIHDAHVADYLLCAARTAPAGKGGDGITLFLVDTGSKGIKCNLLKTLAGNNKQSELIFENVKVPTGNIIGKLNGGWAPLNRSIKIGALMLCAQMTGACQRILEMTVEYAKTRIQFDLPIGIHQHVQAHCVSLVGDADTSRWVTYYAAWRFNEGLDSELDIAIAKAWTSEAYRDGCWRAHQVLAGVGSAERLGLLPIYTRQGSDAHYYLGSPAEYKKIITGELEKLPPHEKTFGKPRGLWDPKRKVVPSWDVWKEYYLTK
jgi:alkylation response protein AidB-like acyl-CoA dehydrogenase